MSVDYLLRCPTPCRNGMADDRHVCDSRDDLDMPFLDDNDEVFYPMKTLILRCVGCGNALTYRDTTDGRWAWYVIDEDPF